MKRINTVSVYYNESGGVVFRNMGLNFQPNDKEREEIKKLLDNLIESIAKLEKSFN